MATGTDTIYALSPQPLVMGGVSPIDYYPQPADSGSLLVAANSSTPVQLGLKPEINPGWNLSLSLQGNPNTVTLQPLGRLTSSATINGLPAGTPLSGGPRNPTSVFTYGITSLTYVQGGMGTGILSGAIQTGGGGYADGTYYNVPLVEYPHSGTIGSGSGATATITVSGSGGSSSGDPVTAVTITSRGSGYSSSDILSVPTSALIGNGAQLVLPDANNAMVTLTAGTNSTLIPEFYSVNGLSAVNPASGTVSVPNLSLSSSLFSNAVPSIYSGFAPTGNTLSLTNGTASFAVVVGTGTTISNTGIILFPIASNGWNCYVINSTHPTNLTVQTATLPNSVTVTNYVSGTATAWTAGDHLHFNCLGY